MTAPTPPGTPGGSPDRPAVFFADAAEFRLWLERHHATASELWMELRRRGHPDRGLTWEDAVPEALSYGWIDSRSERVDADRRRQRWTPRRRRSTWSAINVAHVERLLAEGRMTPAGLAAYEARRDDLTAIYSYESPEEAFSDAERAALRSNPPAAAFWAAATASYRRVAAHWVTSARRPETRLRRFAQLVEESASGRLVAPVRYGATPAWVARAAEAARAASPG